MKERRDRDRSKRDLEVEGMKMLFTKNKALPNDRKAKKATIMAAREVRSNFDNEQTIRRKRDKIRETF